LRVAHHQQLRERHTQAAKSPGSQEPSTPQPISVTTSHDPNSPDLGDGPCAVRSPKKLRFKSLPEGNSYGNSAPSIAAIKLSLVGQSDDRFIPPALKPTRVNLVAMENSRRGLVKRLSDAVGLEGGLRNPIFTGFRQVYPFSVAFLSGSVKDFNPRNRTL
jgi:hypothetical protein